ncbi:MAG: BamA/TamA family outer membrane protein, partial [Gemmatimonadetes bacterium]|nr:BamA/TamA family outer membrane protein [Gemmatimonadota bacterium]NIQ58518.1 BamA/TamA family outer membrane protein [Gemmatimonadota bacterium]NIU78715.1 BamA/TamA family outer membrane protein [Gammaproteobacteria bacterium]NIX47534.1 BamA/TamA family outer membrane protein [Gemmatimonadota bacterium]NIY11904.1 BamA/TamA family outer membrane protein [Gemmatimonadota bacterium]
LELQQYVGGHRSVLLGAGIHRVIDPIEANGISDTENSLSTFILHRDYRDHYTRHGWSAFLRYYGRTRPLEAAIEYQDERHGSSAPRTPWSLLDNDEAWRLQPRIAEGDLRSIRGSLRWDTRNDRVDPAAGWLVEAEVEQGLEGDLRYLAYDPAFPGDPDPPVVERSATAEFTTARLDVRRYLRVGPHSRFALRAAFAGSPDDGALPAQRQHVLGGEGTLPGYDRWAFDCGARDAVPVDSFTPYYGCDRSVLFQAEYRHAFLGSGGLGLGRLLGLDFDLVTNPELVVFADAGRAWIEAESRGTRVELGTSDLQVDAGLGLRLGRLGLYLAVPLSGGADGPNFFIRLGPRL